MHDLGVWIGKAASYGATVFITGLMLALGAHAGLRLAARWFGPVTITQVHRHDG